MTRKTRRDIERELEDISNPSTGLNVTIRREHIMTRKRAEREGREIIGPADTPGDTDFARVRIDS